MPHGYRRLGVTGPKARVQHGASLTGKYRPLQSMVLSAGLSKCGTVPAHDTRTRAPPPSSTSPHTRARRDEGVTTASSRGCSPSLVRQPQTSSTGPLRLYGAATVMPMVVSPRPPNTPEEAPVLDEVDARAQLARGRVPPVHQLLRNARKKRAEHRGTERSARQGKGRDWGAGRAAGYSPPARRNDTTRQKWLTRWHDDRAARHGNRSTRGEGAPFRCLARKTPRVSPPNGGDDTVRRGVAAASTPERLPRTVGLCDVGRRSPGAPALSSRLAARQTTKVPITGPVRARRGHRR